MNITDELIKLDPSLVIHNEGEWNKTISEYGAFNDAGVECEVGEFLYSMVRVLKPTAILETGTHFGIGASYMGMGLRDNNIGRLDTVEFLPEIHKVAQERMTKLDLNGIVTCHLMDFAQFNPTGAVYDLILLDTEPQTRFGELVRTFNWLKEGGFMFIHDLHRHMGQMDNTEHGFAWPWGKIPKEMVELIKTGKMRPFHFSTPRGLTGFYKVSQEDYKW